MISMVSGFHTISCEFWSPVTCKEWRWNLSIVRRNFTYSCQRWYRHTSSAFSDSSVKTVSEMKIKLTRNLLLSLMAIQSIWDVWPLWSVCLRPPWTTFTFFLVCASPIGQKHKGIDLKSVWYFKQKSWQTDQINSGSNSLSHRLPKGGMECLAVRITKRSSHLVDVTKVSIRLVNTF